MRSAKYDWASITPEQWLNCLDRHIAAHLGCTRQTVQMHRQKFGLKRAEGEPRQVPFPPDYPGPGASLEDRIRYFYSYDPATGMIRWRNPPLNPSGRPHKRALRPPGVLCRKYLIIRDRGTSIYVHRMAFFLMTGRWPSAVTRHSRDRYDNRWANLTGHD